MCLDIWQVPLDSTHDVEEFQLLFKGKKAA